MQAKLQHDPGVAAAAIEVRHLVLDRQHGAHRVGWIVERGHHRIAHGLDDETMVALHPLRQKGEMIAHQMVGGGVAQFLIHLGRALQIGEHDRDPADFDVVARPQELLGTEPAERRHGDDAFPGQGVSRPIAVLDDEEQRPVGVVVRDDLVLMPGFRQHDIGAAGGDFGDDPGVTDIGLRLAAGLDRAETIGAGSEREREAFARMRRDLGLQLDMRGRALPEHAQLAFGQEPQPRLGMKGQLDIAREVAFVVDIARRAMRPLGQLVQMLDPRLGATAARA